MGNEVLSGKVEFIHPYGRGFLIYTDKEWEQGIISVNDSSLHIRAGNTLTVPFRFIVSIDKSINLPVRKEGRAFLLIEYANIKRRETVYLLISAEERFIRKIRFEILRRIIADIKIMYSSGDSWIPGRMEVTSDMLIFKGIREEKIKVNEIMNVERTTVKHGLNKVGVIMIHYMREGKKNDLGIFVQPIKRVFFWQLIQQMIDDYLNTQVINGLSSLERQVVHLINREWNYKDIILKLELSEEEMEKIVEKLVRYGLIQKIIILRVTDRGKKVIAYLSEEFPQLS